MIFIKTIAHQGVDPVAIAIDAIDAYQAAGGTIPRVIIHVRGGECFVSLEPVEEFEARLRTAVSR